MKSYDREFKIQAVALSESIRPTKATKASLSVKNMSEIQAEYL